MTLSFRPLSRADFGLLSTWLRAPHVATWWCDDAELTSIEAQYGPVVDAKEPTEVFVVETEGEPVGMVQRYLVRDYPEWERALAVAGIPSNALSIDYLIGVESLIAKGTGPEMIRTFVEDSFERHPQAPVVTAAVQQANRRSWRALEKAGFDRCWAGMLDSEDPSDQGPSYVYLRRRAAP